MRYIKLFLLSAFAFGLVIFLISLVFPPVTYVSRAVNIAGSQELNRADLESRCSTAFSFAGISNRSQHSPGSDTAFFINDYVQGGMAIYPASPDSSTLQVYYKIIVPWYKPWNKFGLMINEEKYGPSLDSALRKATYY